MDAFERLRDAPATVDAAAAFRADVLAATGGEGAIVAGVDRLDYTKGLLPRLEAFSQFLEAYPEHVALVTPLRDGMNLVAQEFAVASDSGVLLLSELAGAADVLGGAVLVNPYDTAGSAPSVRRLDVHDWAETFLTSLVAAAAKAARRG